jgi:hypothetical protein
MLLPPSSKQRLQHPSSQQQQQQRRRQQQQQHALQPEAWEHVLVRVFNIHSRLWSALAAAAVLRGTTQLAPLVLQMVLQTLTFVQGAQLRLFEEHGSDAGGSSSSVSSSSGNTNAPSQAAAGVLLVQYNVIKCVQRMQERAVAELSVAQLVQGGCFLSRSPLVRTAAMQLVLTACPLLHQRMMMMQQQQRQQQQTTDVPGSEQQTGSTSHSSSSSSSRQQAGNESQRLPIPAFHDGLLHMLPGDVQAYTAAEGAAAVTLEPSLLRDRATVRTLPAATAPASHLCRMATTALQVVLSRGSAPTAAGRQSTAAAGVSAGDMLQLAVELQLLAAALAQEGQQQEERPQQQQQPEGEHAGAAAAAARSDVISLLVCSNRLVLQQIRVVCDLRHCAVAVRCSRVVTILQ